MIYGDGTKFQAFSAQGVGHFVPTDVSVVLDWFGITGSTSTSTITSSATVSSTQSPTTTSPTTSTTGTSGCTVAHWDQCGGIGYGGCSTCAASFICQELNAYYSQCL